MTGRINLALVIHHHQPVDNDDKVIEEVYSKSYFPFLKCLSEFPQVKANLHYSGYLLEWLQIHHPEFIKRLQKTVDRGQVEIIGGGYYEPILSTIRERDALGQINLLNKKIEALFGCKAKGLWTAERAWEPSSPELLAQAGLKYTILDDTIFHLAGIAEQDCFTPFIVESRGSCVVVFPLLKKLRYFIPFKDVSKTITYLSGVNRQHERETGAIAVYADDGEKFGAWPTTYDAVYTKGWLRTFFETLVRNRAWLYTIKLSEQLAEMSITKRVHLPSASYQELMEWSLPAKQHRGGQKFAGERTNGFWRAFLSKYSESGRLYSRMISVSKMLDHFRGTEDIRERALIELWKAQCNDVYWHGIFGGLYFPKFRRIAYHHLIRAQSLIESMTHGKTKDKRGWISIQNTMKNNYCNDSITFNTGTIGLTVDPLLGGSVTEIDYKPAALNIVDVLARRYESYHDKILKTQRKKSSKDKGKAISIHELFVAREQGLRELLVYDRFPKVSFLDYILRGNTTIAQFQRQEFVELAQFGSRPYEWKEYRNRACKEESPRRAGPLLNLARTAKIQNNQSELITVNKSISIDPKEESKFTLDYDVELRKKSDKSAELKFATEINLGSLGDTGFEKSFGRLSSFAGIRILEFGYPELGVSVILNFDQDISVWVIPIRSVSKSEAGFESNLQGISIVPTLDLNYDSHVRFSVSTTIRTVKRIREKN